MTEQSLKHGDRFLLVLYYPSRQFYKKRCWITFSEAPLMPQCLWYFRKPEATNILFWLWARSPSPLFCLQRDTGFSLAKELRCDPNYFSSYCPLLSLPNVPKQPCGPATSHFLTSLPDSILANSLWYLPFQAHQLNQRLQPQLTDTVSLSKLAKDVLSSKQAELGK